MLNIKTLLLKGTFSVCNRQEVRSPALLRYWNSRFHLSVPFSNKAVPNCRKKVKPPQKSRSISIGPILIYFNNSLRKSCEKPPEYRPGAAVSPGVGSSARQPRLAASGKNNLLQNIDQCLKREPVIILRRRREKSLVVGSRAAAPSQPCIPALSGVQWSRGTAAAVTVDISKPRLHPDCTARKSDQRVSLLAAMRVKWGSGEPQIIIVESKLGAYE